MIVAVCRDINRLELTTLATHSSFYKLAEGVRESGVWVCLVAFLITLRIDTDFPQTGSGRK